MTMTTLGRPGWAGIDGSIDAAASLAAGGPAGADGSEGADGSGIRSGVSGELTAEA